MSFRAKKKSKDNSFLEIDLSEMFGKEVADSSSFRQAVGQQIIDTIQERTESGKFLSPAKQKYSDEYAETIEFKVHGKSQSDVNLKQTGDMLNTMTIIDSSPGKIVIGWDDSEERAKATNHNFGVTVPRREFLGLTEKESRNIASEFGDRLEAANRLDTSRAESGVSDSLTNLVLREFGVEQRQREQESDNVRGGFFRGLIAGVFDGEG